MILHQLRNRNQAQKVFVLSVLNPRRFALSVKSLKAVLIDSTKSPLGLSTENMKINIKSGDMQSQEVTPRLFAIQASVKGNNGGIAKLLLYVGVHHTLEEAQRVMVDDMMVNKPELYNYIQKNGISFHQSKAYTPEILNESFEKHRKKDEEKNRGDINYIMRKLIKGNDFAEVEKYRDQLSEEHIEFVKKAIFSNRHKKH